MTTTFRVDTRAGLYSMLQTFQSSHNVLGTPGYLAHVYSAPPSEPRTPCAYIEKQMPEQDGFDAQVYRRALVPKIVVLSKLSSNVQSGDEQDALVDLLVDLVISNARTIVTGARVYPTAVDDGEQTYGNAVYAGFALTMAAVIQLGRGL